jgi:hypothetical protein
LNSTKNLIFKPQTNILEEVMRYTLYVLPFCIFILSFSQANAVPKFSATTIATSGTINIPGPSDIHTGFGENLQSFASNSTQKEDAEFGGQASIGRGFSESIATSLPGKLSLYAAATAAASTTIGPNEVPSPRMVGQGASSASGSIDDSFTILPTNCSQVSLCGVGSSGSFSFSIVTEGKTDGGGEGGVDPGSHWSGYSNWVADLSLQTGLDSAIWHGDHNINIDSSRGVFFEDSHDSLGIKTFTVNFEFGLPIAFHLSGTVAAGASADSANVISSPTSAFLSDLFHTLAWGGISTVNDFNGNHISFTALSAGTGFDYSKSYVSNVPIPASAFLMFGGLFSMLLITGYNRALLNK